MTDNIHTSVQVNSKSSCHLGYVPTWRTGSGLKRLRSALKKSGEEGAGQRQSSINTRSCVFTVISRMTRELHSRIVEDSVSETEILNNFCPSRFSLVCPDFHVLQNANLYRKFVWIFSSMYRLAFLTRKSRRTGLRFEKKMKIWTH